MLFEALRKVEETPRYGNFNATNDLRFLHRWKKKTVVFHIFPTFSHHVHQGSEQQPRLKGGQFKVCTITSWKTQIT